MLSGQIKSDALKKGTTRKQDKINCPQVLRNC